MAPEADPAEEVTRGQAVEATLWNTVARLRARGWHISLSGDPACAGRHRLPLRSSGAATTDDELHRHLRPILCGREERAGTVLRGVPGEHFGRAACGYDGRVPPPTAPALALRPRAARGRARSPRRRRHPSFGAKAIPSNPNTPSGSSLRVSWMTWVWIVQSSRPRQRRSACCCWRCASGSGGDLRPAIPGIDLELRWAAPIIRSIPSSACGSRGACGSERASAARRSTSDARSMRRSVPACGSRRASSSTSACRSISPSSSSAARTTCWPPTTSEPSSRRRARSGGAPGRPAAAYPAHRRSDAWRRPARDAPTHERPGATAAVRPRPVAP